MGSKFENRRPFTPHEKIPGATLYIESHEEPSKIIHSDLLLKLRLFGSPLPEPGSPQFLWSHAKTNRLSNSKLSIELSGFLYEGTF